MLSRLLLFFVLFSNVSAFAAESPNQQIIDAFKAKSYNEFMHALESRNLDAKTVLNNEGLQVIHVLAALGKFDRIFTIANQFPCFNFEIQTDSGLTPLDLARIVQSASQNGNFQRLENRGLGSIIWLLTAHENAQGSKMRKARKNMLAEALRKTLNALNAILIQSDSTEMSYVPVVTSTRRNRSPEINGNNVNSHNQAQVSYSAQGFDAQSGSEIEEEYIHHVLSQSLILDEDEFFPYFQADSRTL